jgi:hypothetical protein
MPIHVGISFLGLKLKRGRKGKRKNENIKKVKDLASTFHFHEI